MAKAKNVVANLEDAIAAFGGERKFCRAFRMRKADLEVWREQGNVPRAHALGLYLGLSRRGFEVSPRLFNLTKWTDIEGV
jgi:hypothetical protein